MFIVINVKTEILYTFLLLIPVVIDLLAFNYQSNQCSLESISKYYYEHLKSILDKAHSISLLDWEKHFAVQKKPFRFESVTKVFPFILPSLIPLYFLIARIPLKKYQIAIVIIDLILLILMIENFRYKLRRVK